MDQVEWGKLARLQDSIVHNDDLRQRQRQNHHKLLYKNDLQKMIDEKRKYSHTIDQSEKNFYSQLYKSSNKAEEATPGQIKFQGIVKQSAQYNLTVDRSRRERLKSELNEEKCSLKDQYRKLDTEISEERQRSQLLREDKKKQLGLYYEKQMSSVDSKRELQKLENRKFEQVASELQSRREQQRKDYMTKLKNGYSQNPESYNLIQHLYREKEQKKQSELGKMENSRVDGEEERSKEINKERNHLQTIQTGQFNKNCFMEKQARRRYMQQRQLDEENQKIMLIQQELNEAEEKVRKKKASERKILQEELDHQILETGENRLKQKRMSQNESKINKELFGNDIKVMLPGIVRDHKDLKREFIMDNFIKGGPAVAQSNFPSLASGSGK